VTRRIHVFINAAAGTRDKENEAAELQTLFRAAGIDAQITLARSGSALAELGRKAALERPDAVVAGGGDGTVNCIAAALAGTDIPLGILPLGTLNHFAKDLGLPLPLADAARVIIEGRVSRVDVGMVNDRIFVNNSSLGLYPWVVRRRVRMQQHLGWGKWPAFAWAIMAVLRRHGFMDVQLKVNGTALTRRTPFVFVGNNDYRLEGLHPGGRASLTDGVLSVYVAHRTGRWGLVRLALRALTGTLRNAREFDAFDTREVTIETRRSTVQVARDGEVSAMSPPLVYRILPLGLKVIVPHERGSAADAGS
jgi:diacylglycerol kinase family enzyme